MDKKRFLLFTAIVFLAFVLSAANPRSTLAASATNIVEYALPNADSGAVAITSGPDGALWFVEFATNKIGRMTQNGAISEFAIPTANSNPSAITAGPDANLWFTESSANKIVQMTTNGAVVEYNIPTANSYPIGIVAGADGALWFTEFAANAIGRITTDGTITEFVIPSQNFYPYDIVAGADNALWFTGGSNKIGRLTTSGGYNEFALSSSATNITVGADGALWFTEYYGNKIGRVTLAGEVKEFALSSATSQPEGITLGADGNLWFTEHDGNQIARFGPSDELGEFPLPNVNSAPRGIVAGPDGNIWFVEETGNRIGRFVLTNSSPPLSLRLPFDQRADASIFDSLVTLFDHEYPVGVVEPPYAASTLYSFDGQRRVGTVANCVQSLSCYSGHNGYDFAFDGGLGAPVLAANDGLAVATQEDCVRGDRSINVVRVTQGRYRTEYLHLLDDVYWRALLNQPRQVRAGERIGSVGNSGYPLCSTGPHLHFGVAYDTSGNGNFQAVDPFGFQPTQKDPWTLYAAGNPVSVWLWEFDAPAQTFALPGSTHFLATDNIRARIPANAVTNPELLALTIAPPAGSSNSTNGKTVGVGEAFRLTSTMDTNSSQIAFASPITYTISFANSNLTYIKEDSLNLYRWDAGRARWAPLVTNLDFASEQATAATTEAGLYSLRGQPLYPAPAVDSISPATLMQGVETTIVIRGANFLATPRVFVGVTALNAQPQSVTELIVTVPPLAPGVYTLTLRNPDGQTATLQDAITVSAR